MKKKKYELKSINKVEAFGKLEIIKNSKID